MPNRVKSGIHARKRSAENPGQAIPLPPPRKKLPPVLGKVEGNNFSFFKSNRYTEKKFFVVGKLFLIRRYSFNYKDYR